MSLALYSLDCSWLSVWVNSWHDCEFAIFCVLITLRNWNHITLCLFSSAEFRFKMKKNRLLNGQYVGKTDYRLYPFIFAIRTTTQPHTTMATKKKRPYVVVNVELQIYCKYAYKLKQIDNVKVPARRHRSLCFTWCSWLRALERCRSNWNPRVPHFTMLDTYL